MEVYTIFERVMRTFLLPRAIVWKIAPRLIVKGTWSTDKISTQLVLQILVEYSR